MENKNFGALFNVHWRHLLIGYSREVNKYLSYITKLPLANKFIKENNFKNKLDLPDHLVKYLTGSKAIVHEWLWQKNATLILLSIDPHNGNVLHTLAKFQSKKKFSCIL